MKPFKILCNSAGIYSVQEASDFFDIRLATCRQYWYAEKKIPQGIINELYDAYLEKIAVDKELEEMTLSDVEIFINGEKNV